MKLSSTAISLGNSEIPERCFQMIREFDKLNFFYATTGSVSKLFKMQTVAENLKEPMLRFNTSILTGNIEETEQITYTYNSQDYPISMINTRTSYNFNPQTNTNTPSTPQTYSETYTYY